MSLAYYKRGQGNRVRYSVIALFQLVLLIAVYQFHQAVFFRLPTSWRELRLNIVLAAVLWALGTIVGYLFLNRPRTADFLVEVDLELNKVTWASRREVLDASGVVLVTLISLTVVISIADFLLGYAADAIAP
ncbi:MAG: preprotein translocase subunit SecE [Planctomycetota bacterium]